MKNLWRHVLGLAALGWSVVVDAVEFDVDAEAIVATVRVRRNTRRRCGVCGRRSAGYDQGRSAQGPRRWRGLDLGTIRVFLEAEMWRVSCRDHGVVAAQVPWARHGSWFTRDFEDTIGWLATATSKSSVTELMRVGWRTVGGVVTRLQAEIDSRVDRFDGVTRIGIDEISYKRGHKYLTIVVDHDSGNLLWAAVGRDKATLDKFFELLGPDRCALITHTSADAAPWIAKSITEHCPQAVRCADAFHVVAWATDALDELRRQAWNDARKDALAEPKRGSGRPTDDAPARPAAERVEGLKGARCALWKNPENLTVHQQASLPGSPRPTPACIAATCSKKDSGSCFRSRATPANKRSIGGCHGRNDAGSPPSSNSDARSEGHRAEIEAALDHRLSNALIESTNTKIRVLTRVAYGFKSPETLIALAMLSLGGHRPDLPGRTTPA